MVFLQKNRRIRNFYFVVLKKSRIFASLNDVRAVSSAGSERLPYKQDVGGSNPSLPTEKSPELSKFRAFSLL